MTLAEINKRTHELRILLGLESKQDLDAIESALIATTEDATKHAICDCIDRIGGDAYNGMRHTVEELQKHFFETHQSLEKRAIKAAIDAETDACEAVITGFIAAHPTLQPTAKNCAELLESAIRARKYRRLAQDDDRAQERRERT